MDTSMTMYATTKRQAVDKGKTTGRNRDVQQRANTWLINCRSHNPRRSLTWGRHVAVAGAVTLVVDTRADRHLADRAANISLKAWLQRTRGATLPAWAAGIDVVDLDRLPRPDSGDDIYSGMRLWLLCAQWGDAGAAQRLCDAAQDMCSTDTRRWQLAPLLLRKAVALWHPIVARANDILVRLFVPVLADIAAANATDDGPTCIACMCEPPTMVLEPCGHLCLCADDCQRLIDGPRRSLKCPLCRAPVEAAWRVRSLSAPEEHAIDKPLPGLSSQTPPTDPQPEQDDPTIADILRLGLDLDNPTAMAAAIRTIYMLNAFERLFDSMEPSLISGLGGGLGFDNTTTDAPRRHGHTSARGSAGNNDDGATREDGYNHSSLDRPSRDSADRDSESDRTDSDDDDVWGEGYSYRSMRLTQGRQRSNTNNNEGDDSDTSSSSSSDDDDGEDEMPDLVENDSNDIQWQRATRRREASVGIESTGLPFARDDVDLVASQARVSHDIAFDALLATEGNIIDAIHALC
ncbi:Ring domain containing protein [Pandoravirus salinus]|uniref:Ring domain containing protein n=1 Tax=Pandoravirus salinus TaxID=1349410 RepID=S4VZ83_9VIRU|nr:Ring domain [Pandoravirus salinus]AGO84816.2 Ring domain containing protein [Pandoravirus salinus]